MPDPDIEQSGDSLSHILMLIKSLEERWANQIPLHIEVGMELKIVKTILGHGHFMDWCRLELKRSQCWVAMHMRLADHAHYVERALEWAKDTGHDWANCHSVERLLKLIAEYRRTVCGERNGLLRPKKYDEDIDKFEKRIQGCEGVLLAICDLLAPAWQVRARELARSVDAPKARLAELVLHVQLRVNQASRICSPMQFSTPPNADSDERDDAGITESGSLNGMAP